MKLRQQTTAEGPASRTAPAKGYEPVREFERQTSYCPLYLAWRTVDEARDYFRTDIPEAYADKLAGRAEAVFANQPFWQRKFQNVRGRDAILMAMRHWLASVLAKENPVLLRQLPESFKIGMPLPERTELSRQPSTVLRTPSPVPTGEGHHLTPPLSPTRRGRNIRPRFVHGCELLTA